MLTRCPACQTTFRVTEEQAQAHKGMVRCGRCRAVFNSHEHAVAQTHTATTEIPAAVTAPATTSAATEFITPHQHPALPSAAEQEAAALFGQTLMAEVDEPNTAATHSPTATHQAFVEPTATEHDPLEDALDAADHAAPVETAQDVAPSDEVAEDLHIATAADDLGDIADDATTDNEVAAAATTTAAPDAPALDIVQPKIRTKLWASVAALATLLLMAQGLYIWRGSLAQNWPGVRPTLVSLCTSLGCEIPIPRDDTQVSIESSELHPVGNDPDRLFLQASLRNRAAFDQAWPNIELTLTDSRDNVVIRKVLTSAEYLPRSHQYQRTFAASSDVAITLQFKNEGSPASGYNMLLYYP